MAIEQGATESNLPANINRVPDGPRTAQAGADMEARKLLGQIALSMRQLVAGMSLLVNQDLTKLS